MAQNRKNNVLVVGGSSGIGLAVAKLSLQYLPNPSVVITSSNENNLKEAMKEIKSGIESHNPTIDYVVGDVGNIKTQVQDVEEILKAAVSKFGGKIDHIVWTAGRLPVRNNNAQRNNDDIIELATPRLFGPLALTFLAKEYMNDTRHSSITISSGVRLYRPVSGMGRLAGAAGGMESAARGLAVDLAPIRANSINLGAIETPMLGSHLKDNDAARKRYEDATLCGSIGTPEEAAEAYLYSMRCAYVTGSRIDVDGGAMIC